MNIVCCCNEKKDESCDNNGKSVATLNLNNDLPFELHFEPFDFDSSFMPNRLTI